MAGSRFDMKLYNATKAKGDVVACLSGKERMKRLHLMVEDEGCCLCGEATETRQHLFMECYWMNEVKTKLSNWFGVIIPRGTVKQTLAWIKRRRWRQLKKEMVAAMYGAMIYYSWQARNWKQFRKININTEFTIA